MLELIQRSRTTSVIKGKSFVIGFRPYAMVGAGRGIYAMLVALSLD